MFLNSVHRISKALSGSGKIFIRNYATRNRFYKTTGILKSDGKFEITLDQRKLKTPKGQLFYVESEPLALAVATEWNAQKKKIVQSKMHLTTLCNTVLDNPNNLTKLDIVNYIVNYLDTDTVLYQANEDEDLLKFQINEWDPVIDWFNKRFNVKLRKSVEMDVSPVSKEDKTTLIRHLMSYNFAAINGFVYGVDTLKSVILTLAATERFITPEKAVLLSRLEEEYQTGTWGRVEWAHDLNQQELQSRLSAVVLFVYFNSQSSKIQQKNIQ
ncbi:ATP synthase mitochondrial F1 complex assembly factor 2 [Anthonomus grandis grandis]|uniref:ATP synthase mitochondrial F1 complex assembly factor 2 n=1 Tax=Anthonomus grandis grandis TaxID=2921223 RepID=UPI0021661F4A|nr:ATP synthase mitochondrial F1 complex assembly factor 2 [Anthonomus grandis grandis]